MNLKLYTGRAGLIVNLLDSIILQNDKLVNNRIKQECAMADGMDLNALGMDRINEGLEKQQQDMADQIAQEDKRGTIRIMITKDYLSFLGQEDADKTDQHKAATRLMTLGLVNIYRMRPPKQTDVILKTIKKLPTTGRDYTMFWRSWGYKAIADRIRES